MLHGVFFPDNETVQMKWEERVYIFLRTPRQSRNKLFAVIRHITRRQMVLKFLKDDDSALTCDLHVQPARLPFMCDQRRRREHAASAQPPPASTTVTLMWEGCGVLAWLS